MKHFFLLLLILLFSSCFQKEERKYDVVVDLDRTASQILYSSFVDSLDYMSLNLIDNQMLSGVERLYIDGDYLLIQDEKRGLFVFSLKQRSLLNVIDNFGNGPGEFGRISAFTFNPDQRLLLIYSYPFLHKYTYDGTFVESIKNTDHNFVDFYYTDTGEYICIAPEDTGPEAPCGVWLVDSTFHYIKQLKEIPPKQLLFTRSTFYNRTDCGIYYYDRVWDDFSFITSDSVEMMYSFDFKQKVPMKRREQETPFRKLSEYSFIGEFVNSDRFILLNYFQFGTGDISWVLLDKKENKVICSKQFQNDISPVDITSNKLFYINNETWCRVLDFGENEEAINLEFIYLKK